MVATNEKTYTWRPTVKIGTAARQDAKVRAWDDDGTSVIIVAEQTTDANGQIPIQYLFDAYYEVDATPPPTAFPETPHKIRTTYISSTAIPGYPGKYATIVNEFEKDVDETASLNTIFLRVDNFVTNPKSTIDLYSGIAFTHGSTLLTVSANRTILEVYERTVSEGHDTPQYATTAIMETVDGNTIFVYYDLEISATALVGGGKILSPQASKTITFLAGANFTGNLTIDGDLYWNSNNDISNLTVTGDLRINTGVNSNINVSNVNVSGNVWNDAAANTLTLNAVNSTLTAGDPGTGVGQTNILQAVPIAVTVLDDSTGSPLSTARVFLNTLPGLTTVLSEECGADGIADDTWNYTGDQQIGGWAREQDLSTPDYEQRNISGTITSAGFSTTVRLKRIN